VPAAGAWIDMTGFQSGQANTYQRTDLATPAAGRYTDPSTSANCQEWTTQSYSSLGTPYDTTGVAVTAAGPTYPKCKEARPLACCASPMREKLRGYTTGTTGAVGGREMMNYLCGSQFPGSHFCHYAEYQRTGTTQSPPAGGAWVDMSGFQSGQANTYQRTDLASAIAGRYTDSSTSANCQNWTALSYSSLGTPYDTTGVVVTPAGAAYPKCKELHAAACCQ
jgi:hypothetical protein